MQRDGLKAQLPQLHLTPERPKSPKRSFLARPGQARPGHLSVSGKKSISWPQQAGKLEMRQAGLDQDCPAQPTSHFVTGHPRPHLRTRMGGKSRTGAKLKQSVQGPTGEQCPGRLHLRVQARTLGNGLMGCSGAQVARQQQQATEVLLQRCSPYVASPCHKVEGVKSHGGGGSTWFLYKQEQL